MTGSIFLADVFALRGDIEAVRLAEMFNLFVESLVVLSTRTAEVLRPGDDTVRDVMVVVLVVVPAAAATRVRGFGATDVTVTVGREMGALNREEERFSHEIRKQKMNLPRGCGWLDS